MYIPSPIHNMEENSFINFDEGRKFISNDLFQLQADPMLLYKDNQNEHQFLLKRFYEVELQSSKKSLQDACAKKDRKELNRKARTLKITSSYIGAVTCGKLSERLELLCADWKVPEKRILDSADELMNHLDCLHKYLSNYFNCEAGRNALKIKSESGAGSSCDRDFKEETSTSTKKSLVPPKSRLMGIDFSCYYEDDEIDTLDDFSNQWRCIVI
ncbi:hypothetical protein SteCoe_22068 [Stentor coeruleus]|uniref:Uncharacterized protein n=1 Tax=Stentor coeruleus TaxID=5963 RepID=A0A1R2BN49_9CILI|nr:hypothetical protein SteCoe_22068 [Stentor coeruleus]